MTASGQVCSIVSHATVEVPLSTVDSLRDGGGSPTAASLPKRFLRHCDEQTVVGTVAAIRAVDAWPQPRPSFERFAVFSASCQLGRIMGAKALAATRTAGAQGVSPHVVPQCSLHSPASAVSVGLSMHGPHIGIGGGPEAFDEGILTAWSLLPSAVAAESGCAHGLWLILTGWEAEPSLDPQANPISNPACRAIAMGIMPGVVAGATTLELTRGETPESNATGLRGDLAPVMAAIAGTTRRTLPLMHGFTLHVRPAGGDASREAA